ncbi:MAG: NTP transferase domain-containing protein [Ideonella sp.]|jgi:molybdenum cofactor cytidylyltransferase|nr:NTP transferase domain-containing protein [Ideonella sp.]
MGCILKGGGGLYSRLVVGAVLRAAGPAALVDGRPIGLLELGGVPVVRRLLVALSGAGVDEVVVVLDDANAALEPVVQTFPITLARHAGEDDGTGIGAWRTGLAALGGKLDAVMLLGVAQPLLHAQDLVDLIGAYKKRPDGADRLVPLVEGVPGGPVVINETVRPAILTGLDRTHTEPVAGAATAWATQNRRYRMALDGPEALARFERETGHALRWPAQAVPVGPLVQGPNLSTADAAGAA